MLLHPEVFAQIHPAHVDVIDNVGRRALRQHTAVADDVGVVTNAQCFAHIVVGDQHPDTAVFQETDDALNLCLLYTSPSPRD